MRSTHGPPLTYGRGDDVASNDMPASVNTMLGANFTSLPCKRPWWTAATAREPRMSAIVSSPINGSCFCACDMNWRVLSSRAWVFSASSRLM